jgi:hypothetical protein
VCFREEIRTIWKGAASANVVVANFHREDQLEMVLDSSEVTGRAEV